MPSVTPHRLQPQVTLGPGDCVPYTEAKADGGTSCDWQCYATLVLLNGTAVTAPRARRATAWPRSMRRFWVSRARVLAAA